MFVQPTTRAPTQDKVSARETRKQRAFFAKVRRAQGAYAVNLRKIAKHVEDLIKAFDPNDAGQIADLEAALRRYSDLLTPWARVTAKRMLVDVSRRDEKVWQEYTKFLGVNLREEIVRAPTGEVMRDLLNDQVRLITSLPLDAAQRVHELAVGELYGGGRANEIAGRIAKDVKVEMLRTGETVRSRANLIARTEVGRAQTTLTQARAQFAGSTHYVWTTAHDYDVRKIHKKLDGTAHAWNDPPVSGEKGERSHPGCIYNCRCVAMPILPGEPRDDQVNWHAER